MPEPAASAIAEGDMSTGEHWVVWAGGTREDFETFLETIYPDGRHDKGGMAGPALYRDSLINTYTGGTDRGCSASWCGPTRASRAFNWA